MDIVRFVIQFYYFLIYYQKTNTMNRYNYFLSFILCLFTLSHLSSQNYSALVTGVTALQTTGTPGEMGTTTATNSAAIAGKLSAAISIASITTSNGKMLTVAHEGFFIDSDINLANNIVFATNAINWLSPVGKKSIIISSLHQEWANPTNLTTFANRAISNGYTITYSNGAFTAANLTGVGVVVIGNAWGTITQAELDLLATHLQNGGGILAMGLGWSWGGNANDYPMNKVAALAGQRFIQGTNPSPINNFYPNVLAYNLTQAQSVIDSITTAYPTNLATALQPAGTLQDKWTAANNTLKNIVETTPVNSAERTIVYNFYKTQFNKRPNYFKKTVSFNKSTENFFGWSRENIFKIFRDALVLNAANKTDIATTLGLTGRYLDIWNAASVLIADNNSLDVPQKEYLYQLYSLIPTSVHNVGIMTFKDLIDGGTPSLAYANISGVVNSYAINSFSNAIGTFSENQFPSDIAAGTVDIFCAAAPHEVTHVIDAYLSNLSTVFKNRKNQLVAQAGTTDLQYLRSMVTGAFFQASPQEFMASIANQYQVDSKKVFQLARQRFDSNFKEPMNQALFFAEIYAQTATETYFYNTTLSGVLTRATIPCTKDAAGYINKLSYDGVDYNFVRDPANGNVLSYSVGTPNPSNTYCISKGNLPWQEWIVNVQFGTINNTSSKEGYGNFTSQITTVAKGTSYPLSISQGFSWAADPTNATQQGKVWIDYNQNGTFEDAELVASFTRTSVTANILIPTTALTGSTRMRVSLKTIGAPTACEVFDKGEVEDYSVNITGGTVSGIPKIVITNVTGPTTATPGSQVTLAVTVTNTGGAPTVPTKLYYRQNGVSAQPLPLTNDTAIIAPLAPNETRVISYTFTLKNPIYPPNTNYLVSGFSPLSFGDYYVVASNETIFNSEPSFKYNITPIFPQANISVNVVPNKTILQRQERWSAIYSVKNNSNTLVKQVFVNLGTFNLFGRNYIAPNYQIDSFGIVPANTIVQSSGGEFRTVGLEVFDLAAGETRELKVFFSNVLTYADFYTAAQDTSRTTLPFPKVNAFSNVVNTNTTVGTDIKIICYPQIASNLPDLIVSRPILPNPSVVQGQILNFTFDLQNISTANAIGNFNIKSYLSKDQTLSTDDYQDGIVPTANLVAGAITRDVAGAMTVRNTVPPGLYYLILKVDGDDQITESNETNNVLPTYSVTVTAAPTNTSCLNRFTLDFIFPNAGECTGIPPTPNVNPASLQMLGSRISDGFALYIRQTFNYDLQTKLFAKTAPTTTPPAGVTFRTCTGANWLYFKTDGYSEDERFSTVIPSRYVRVAYFGAETNPDSIIVETEGSSISLKSNGKTLNCSNCVATDRTPPVFNCPTTTITYSQPFSPNTLRLGNIINTGFTTPGTNLQVTDNCITPLIGFQFLSDVYWGGVYPISLVAYDSAGNKAACNFNLRMPCSASVSAPTISNCPTNISVQAATGQMCAIATWTAPTFSGNGSPTALFSNFASGTCFPIGTTPVVLTAKDSCNNASTCNFNVTVTSGTTGGAYCASKGTAPWEYWVGNVSLGTINNTSDKFKDFATLGYSDYTSFSTTLNKGISYPLSISPGLSWIGNVPNAYCRVWIDFNQNKTFEANELVLEKTNQNPLTQSVLIPADALTGATRMRVSLKFGAYPTACETFDRGEVEDYTVNIAGGTSGGTPNLKITNVTGPTSARPGDAITLNVTVTNAGTGATLPTKLSYQLQNYFGFNYLLTNDSVTVPALAANETRTISYALTLKNPIYPPNALFIGDGFKFGSIRYLDYYVYATNKTLTEVGTLDSVNFKYNLNVIYPQANISLNVVPNKTILQRGETWNATYSVKNNSNILVKQLFVNIGTFGNLGRNNVPRNFQVETISNQTANSSIRTVSNSGETFTNGWEVLDLAAGETRTVTFNFSKIVTIGDFNSTDTSTTTITLEFPTLNTFSNVVNTNTTVGVGIPISVVPSALPDLTVANVNAPTPSVSQGQILNFKFDLRNLSAVNATGNFNIKSYLSIDQTLSADDYQDGVVPTANLAANTTTLAVAGAITVRNTVAAGQYDFESRC
jgi:GEVED domain/CARDB/HYR domain